MKKDKSFTKKFIIDEQKYYDVVALKLIESNFKNIWIEEVKDNKIKFLISNNIFDGDLNLFKGFKFIRENEELSKIELLGLDIFLNIKKVTLLNIEKKLFYIEEFEDNIFRITFSKTFIERIKNKETLIIK